MRAVQVIELSGPDGAKVVEIEAPDANGGLLVDVKAAGVSFPDLLLTRGQYQLKPDPPFTLGSELAGVVRAAPDGSDLQPGDRVAGFVIGGAFAEVSAAAPFLTFKLPDALDFAQGAGYVLN
jgi:NADPH:quinone reductase